jgi:hypothetical protein
MTFALGIPLTALALIGFSMQLIRIRRQTSILIFAFLAYYIPMSLFHIKMEQYLMPVTALLALFSVSILSFWRKLAVRAILVAVSAYTFLYSWGYVDIMANRDTHIIATEWIRKNIPTGTKIGAASHYFYTPPALYSYLHMMPENKNTVDYQFVVTEYKIERLKQERPEYFVITDFEYSDELYAFFWKEDEVRAKKQFLDFLMNGSMYSRIITFEEFPSVFGFKLDARRPPWHMRYVKPEINIYKLNQKTLSFGPIQ